MGAEDQWYRGSSLAVLGAMLLLTFGVAALGGLATGPNIEAWYLPLDKPAWTPPPWLFGPAWTLLYALMAVAAWLVWRAAGPGRRRAPMLVFGVQLALNLAWSWLFFEWHLLLVALVEIGVLWAAILWTFFAFRRASPRAAWLLVPYLGWVAYAASLNAGIWWLNPAP